MKKIKKVLLLLNIFLLAGLLTAQLLNVLFILPNVGRIKFAGLVDPLEAWSEANYLVWKYNDTFAAGRNMSINMVTYLGTNYSDIAQACINETATIGGVVFVKSGNFTTAAGTNVTVKDNVLLIIAPEVLGFTYSLDSGGFCVRYTSDYTYFEQPVNVVITRTAGEALTDGEVVYLDSDGTYKKADANATTTMHAVAVAIEDIANTATGRFLISGLYTNSTWALTVGSETPIYVSGTAGAITQTAPSSTGDQVQRIGYATASDTVYFDFDSTVVELT